MNEYISRIENGEYELVVRCDNYKDFKTFESLIRDKMAKINNKELVTDQLASELKRALLKGLIDGLSQSGEKSDSCKRKGAQTSKACNELHKHKKDNIASENKCNSCKCKSEANENLTDAEITLLKIASISDNPLYLLYVYNYFKQK